MKKLTTLGVVALTALLGVLVLLGFSSPAQAYPDVRINLTVDRQVLYGGESFTATATSNVTCTWDLEWNGEVRESTGTRFVTTFRADLVEEITRIPLRGTCVYDASNSRGATTWQRTIVITVLPPSTAVSPPAGADLPNTGGPMVLFLWGGLALLCCGAAAVFVARRRADQADLAVLHG